MVFHTFINKAANEIKERLMELDSDLTKEDMSYFRTFHSVVMGMLQNILPIELLGYNKDFTVIYPNELEELAENIIQERSLHIKYKNKLNQRFEDMRKGKYKYGNMKYNDDIEILW